MFGAIAFPLRCLAVAFQARWFGQWQAEPVEREGSGRNTCRRGLKSFASCGVTSGVQHILQDVLCLTLFADRFLVDVVGVLGRMVLKEHNFWR